MPTCALPPTTVTPKTVPCAFALLLSDLWWVRVVKLPTVVSSPRTMTRVLDTSVSVKDRLIVPAGAAEQVSENGEKTIVQLKLTEPAPRSAVEKFSARFWILAPVISAAGIAPIISVMVKLLPSDAKLIEL